MDNITSGKIKRLRNLPSFADKTDEEIEEYLRNRKPKEKKKVPDLKEFDQDLIPEADRLYAQRYNSKILQLQEEYGVDMNDSNDAENVRMVVRLTIQLENVDEKIRTLTAVDSSSMDDRQVKNLGDYQKGLVQSITDLQDKLGITRKVRKEKQVDDIPQYLKEIRRKAKDYWNRTTTSVKCERCQIELAHYWLNFPSLANTASFELECWKCGEKVVYVR